MRTRRTSDAEDTSVSRSRFTPRTLQRAVANAIRNRRRRFLSRGTRLGDPTGFGRHRSLQWASPVRPEDGKVPPQPLPKTRRKGSIPYGSLRYHRCSVPSDLSPGVPGLDWEVLRNREPGVPGSSLVPLSVGGQQSYRGDTSPHRRLLADTRVEPSTQLKLARVLGVAIRIVGPVFRRIERNRLVERNVIWWPDREDDHSPGGDHARRKCWSQPT